LHCSGGDESPKLLQVLEVGQAERGAEVFAQVEPVLLGDGGEDFDNFGVELDALSDPSEYNKTNQAGATVPLLTHWNSSVA